LIGPDTVVLTLQNGWGNAPRIASLVGQERLLVGLTYHSGVLLGPGQVQHAGQGRTTIGELDGSRSARLGRVVEAISAAGLEGAQTDNVMKEVWSKLALNCCTLPTTALLRFYAGQLVEHEGTLSLMRALLREVVTVAHVQNIALDFDERWEAITSLLARAAKGRSSMLQDVERSRRTEIEVINGAIADAGRRLGIPTPHNDTMVWLIRALETAYSAPKAQA
jgi:2-dehydropantoate 2-reductase